jgi:small GTP-binding protein
MSIARILSDREEEILVRVRRALRDARLLLEKAGVEERDALFFDSSVHRLDELFLLVVVGEFNSGKSAFINALLGKTLLEEGVTPTTARITIVRHGKEERRQRSDDGFDLVEAPFPVLDPIELVDTPGTNAITREHEAITRDFIPRSDLVLFVTSADRPFTESERAFLESIRDWGKKVLLVVNKVDILTREEDVREVEGFVRENAAKLLGSAPEVFSVSSKEAMRAKASSNPELLSKSRFARLEDHIASVLDDRERVRLKLLNPLGVGLSLAAKYHEIALSELELLEDDLAMLDDVERQMQLYQEDQRRNFGHRLADIDNALLQFEKRGAEFFDETLRLTRIFELINKAKVKSDFERKVVGDLPRVVESRVEGVIDWMVESELRQWKAVMEHIDQRGAALGANHERMVGRIPGTFEQDRRRLLETVGAAAHHAIEGYDRDRESSRLADSVQSAVASTAVIEVSAVGLGTLVSIIATSSAADVTGILAAGALSVVGLLVLPAKRRQAKIELDRKVAAVREQLMTSLRRQFELETEASVARIRDAIAPYTRFVRAERTKLAEARDSLEKSMGEMRRLESEVREL